MKKYPDHELAGIYPPMAPEEKLELRGSLEIEPQLENIVLYEGKVLDGRHRQDVLIDDLKRQPRYINFEELDEAVVKRGPLRYVVGKNGSRRHLTPGQKAIIAAELIPMFQKEAAEHQKLGGKTTSPPIGGEVGNDGFSQETEFDPSDENQSKKASKMAAQAAGASQRSTERARKLLQADPKKAAEVKAAKLSLNKATRDADKEAARERLIEEAQKRVQTVCGKTYADHMKAGDYLTDRRELLAFTDQSDADMLKTKGLIANGFTLARAKKYRMTSLSRTNTISDICLRVLAQGSVSLDVEYQGHNIGIYAKENKSAAAI